MNDFWKNNGLQLVVFVFYAGVTYNMLNNDIKDLEAFKQHHEDDIEYLRAENKYLKAELKDDVLDLENEMKGDMENLDDKFTRRIGKYSDITVQEAEEILRLKFKDKDLEYMIKNLNR